MAGPTASRPVPCGAPRLAGSSQRTALAAGDQPSGGRPNLNALRGDGPEPQPYGAHLSVRRVRWWSLSRARTGNRFICGRRRSSGCAAAAREPGQHCPCSTSAARLFPCHRHYADCGQPARRHICSAFYGQLNAQSRRVQAAAQ